jgi:thiol-disulfide isomerase/thioredoxin
MLYFSGVPMRHVITALAFLVGVGVAFADEPTGPRAQKLAKLQKKFEADEKELQKKLADAKEAEDTQQIAFLTKELYVFAAGDAIELAEEGKKDETGLDAAVFALKLLGKYNATGENMDKAAAIVLENHIDSPKIQPALSLMAESGRTGEEFLKTVAEKTSNKEVKAVAMYYTALSIDAKASDREGPGTEEIVNKMRAEAVDMMEKAVKLAPDTKIGDITLTKAVEGEIASLKIGVGKPLPEVEGVDLDGKKVKLSSLKGKVVLLDVWATWCPPCRAMIPHERELVSNMSKKPFVLLSVSVDTEKATLTEFMATEKMPWNHWWDGAKGPVAKMFKIRAFPTLFLIDAKGVVRKKWVGSPGNEALDKAVEELVAEAEKAK